MFRENFMQYVRTMRSVQATLGRPDKSSYGIETLADAGPCLLVGGSLPPAFGRAWETMDPNDPGGVTYRARLEDCELAESLRERFSYIEMHAVFEHINPVHWAACVRNLYVILKAGGIVSVEVPWLWAYHPGDKRYHFGGDFARLTDEGVRRLFEECPGCCWDTLLCQYLIPEDAPDGVGVCALFKKPNKET